MTFADPPWVFRSVLDFDADQGKMLPFLAAGRVS